MKILQVNLRKLRNEEWFGFFTGLNTLVAGYGAEELGIREIYEKFQDLYRRADSVLVVLRKSVYTRELVRLKQARSRVFRGFSIVTRGYRLSPSPEKRKAAERLYNLFNGDRKDIITGSRLSESAALSSLIGDLAAPLYHADIQTLELQEWFTGLKAAEENYRVTLDERFSESTNKPKEDLRKIRAEISTVYNAIASALNAHLLVVELGGDVVKDPVREENGKPAPEDPVYRFVVAWNERVRKARELVHRRAAYAANEHEVEVSPEVMEAINRGLEDVANGRVISHSDAQEISQEVIYDKKE
jgi:predicted transcriptional regulator